MKLKKYLRDLEARIAELERRRPIQAAASAPDAEKVMGKLERTSREAPFSYAKADEVLNKLSKIQTDKERAIADQYHAEAWERYPEDTHLHREQRAVFLMRMRIKHGGRSELSPLIYEQKLAAIQPQAKPDSKPEPEPGPLDDYKEPPFNLKIVKPFTSPAFTQFLAIVVKVKKRPLISGPGAGFQLSPAA